GGYYLGKSADEISIANIICAVDEWVEFTRCGGRQNCSGGARCLTHTLWDDLSSEIFNFLANISLGDLVRRNLNKSEESEEAPLTVVGDSSSQAA
ncbi:MAG: Rrf2 family transcriptional regulator, partial [Candidatus Thiodiazotropha sp.]